MPRRTTDQATHADHDDPRTCAHLLAARARAREHGTQIDFDLASRFASFRVVRRPIMAAPASATTATAPPLVVEVDRSVRIPDDDAVYTSKVVYERAQFALVLYRDRLAFFGADSKRGTRTLEHGGRGRLGCAR